TAHDELAAGATLPPSFQAELVRSGLENGSTPGATGQGAQGVATRTLLGSAGLQLQQQRQQEAEAALGSAGSLQAGRESALGELATLDNNLRAGAATRAAQAAVFGNNSVPNIGIGGNTVVGMDLSNLNFQNQIKLGLAQLNAGKTLNHASMVNGIISSATS